MVYAGSYDGNMYAFEARSGSVRWTARGGGRISGGPTVIGNVVYFADLDSKSTYGVDARTGKRSSGAAVACTTRWSRTGSASTSPVMPA